MIKTLIIAEAGVNHNGDIKLAKKLIDAAAIAGADFVKFQTFKAKNLTLKTAEKAAYQTRNVGPGISQFDMLKQLEISEASHLELKAYAEQKGIAFLSSAFDTEGLTYLHSLDIPLIKIPSGEITNLPYLQKVAVIGKPVILSTGMANMAEIKEALGVLLSGEIDQEEITILHCNTEYPTPFEDVNLKAMLSIEKEFGIAIGYSDHTLGIELPIAAVALGAKVIEKHFTLDRNMSGPDHLASLEPIELKQMVSSIRNIEKAIAGSGIKKPSLSEVKNKKIARKSICLSTAIEAKTILTEEHLSILRPGSGISPMDIGSVLGKEVINSLPQGHILTWNDLK